MAIPFSLSFLRPSGQRSPAGRAGRRASSKLKPRREHPVEPLENRTVPSVPGDTEWPHPFGSLLSARHLGSSVAADCNPYVEGNVSRDLPGQASAGVKDAFRRKHGTAGKCLLIAFITLVGTVALAAARAEPAWVQKAGLDVWNLGALKEELRTENTRREELRDVVRQSQARMEARDQVGIRLLAGRITLDEAAENMEQIFQANPEWFANVSDTYRLHGTIREICACYLIRFAETRVENHWPTATSLNDPDLALKVSVRISQLKAELSAMKTSTPAEVCANE